MEQRTQFHAEAFTATQNDGNEASLELLGKVQALLREAGLPESIRSSVALDYLEQVVEAQASTLGFQDGFLMIAIVFYMAWKTLGEKPWALRWAAAFTALTLYGVWSGKLVVP